MGISILSYDDMVTLGVVADAGLVPDPEKITAEINVEFAWLRGGGCGTCCAGSHAPGRPLCSDDGRQPAVQKSTAAWLALLPGASAGLSAGKHRHACAQWLRFGNELRLAAHASVKERPRTRITGAA